MMEPVHGKRMASEFAPEDVIGSLPKNVITHILDRLPIQDAVKTCILSRSWRFNWTMLSQLIFDEEFFHYLLRIRSQISFYRTILSRLLLRLQGVVTKFALYIPEKEHNVLDAEDVDHLILFLSTKRLKDLSIMNMHETPLKLPSHLCSCVDLEHLLLFNCCFHPASRFRGFPNLLSFRFYAVIFEGCTFGEFLTQCPLLEILRIFDHDGRGKVKPVEIAKLEHLKFLSMPLCKFDKRAITSCGILKLLGFLEKLEKLDLDFQMCKFLTEAGGKKSVPIALHCLKILKLRGIDLSSCSMVLCAFDLIRASPNLQTLKVVATQEDSLSPPAVCSWEVDCGTMGQLQLRIVELWHIRGSEIEVLENALERALDETFVVKLCSMYELAYVNHTDIKKTLSSWIAHVIPDDFDTSRTLV